ncbi:unnamed protein product [Arctogadus glacialis]
MESMELLTSGTVTAKVDQGGLGNRKPKSPLDTERAGEPMEQERTSKRIQGEGEHSMWTSGGDASSFEEIDIVEGKEQCDVRAGDAPVNRLMRRSDGILFTLELALGP